MLGNENHFRNSLCHLERSYTPFPVKVLSYMLKAFSPWGAGFMMQQCRNDGSKRYV